MSFSRFSCSIARSLALAILSVPLATVASAQATPVGFWNTISDVDGRPTAVVEIRVINDELSAVVRALLVPATPTDSVCGRCSGERHGLRVIGLEIVRRMRRENSNGDEWSGGEILDPENGKTYRARMQVVDGGKKLIVRGYIGLPLLGRSQTWVRTEPTR
jgi:uncharacterized protein (DUF2147 family)